MPLRLENQEQIQEAPVIFAPFICEPVTVISSISSEETESS